jgi:putative tricarboxylic transport membrane protein
MRQDAAGALGLFIFAGLYLYGSAQIPHSSLSDEIGARGMPYVLGVLLAIVSFILFVRALLARKAAPAPATGEAEVEQGGTLPRALGVLACAGLFVALAWAFGYIVASAVTLFVVMRYEGLPFDWRLVAISIGGAVFYWLMFVKFLGVEQPVGFVFGG